MISQLVFVFSFALSFNKRRVIVYRHQNSYHNLEHALDVLQVYNYLRTRPTARTSHPRGSERYNSVCDVTSNQDFLLASSTSFQWNKGIPRGGPDSAVTVATHRHSFVIIPALQIKSMTPCTVSSLD